MARETRPQIGRPEVAAIDLTPSQPVVVTGDRIAAANIDPRTRAFWNLYRGLPRRADIPERSSADPTALRPWLGNLMILDPVDENQDFRYRLYGSNIVEFSGFDMTGRLVSDFSSKTGAFFLECYRNCLGMREPVLTHNAAEHASGMILWERLILPFRTDRGDLQIVATNYPLPLPRAAPG